MPKNQSDTDQVVPMDTSVDDNPQQLRRSPRNLIGTDNDATAMEINSPRRIGLKRPGESDRSRAKKRQRVYAAPHDNWPDQPAPMDTSENFPPQELRRSPRNKRKPETESVLLEPSIKKQKKSNNNLTAMSKGPMDISINTVDDSLLEPPNKKRRTINGIAPDGIINPSPDKFDLKRKKANGHCSHNMQTASATFGSIDLANSGFQLLATGAGVTLAEDSIHLRQPHTFRKQDLAINRILTYLAENMLSNLANEDFAGLAEVQLGWISSLNCLIITENNIELFNDQINGKSFSDILNLLKYSVDKKLRTQGTSEYFKARMKRHKGKLEAFLNEGSVRYGDWHVLDSNVKELREFLNKNNGNIVKIQCGSASDLSKLQDSIVYYDSTFNLKNPFGHAELYHMHFFDYVARNWHSVFPNQSLPKFYVAGTKRACSTCAGQIEAWKKNKIWGENLIAEHSYPGNLWPLQWHNISSQARKNTERNLKNKNIFVTKCRGFDSTVNGFNSDSDSGDD